MDIDPSDKTYCVILGTRPEVLKLAPVVQELRRRGEKILLCATGQHREMLLSALADFELKPDIELNVMTHNQSLAGLTSALMLRLDELCMQRTFSWVIVQRDTTTALTASFCAFYHKIKIAHVEAGLRSFDKLHPFPEEINRKCIGTMADLHFAPTRSAVENLVKENISETSIVLTGNTIVDSLQHIRATLNHADMPDVGKKAEAMGLRIVLVTCHRRESFGKPMLSIFAALRRLANIFSNILFIYPVHLNPNVKESATTFLSGVPNIALIPPLSYRQFLALLDKAYLILSDSGGVQEEAPSFKVPLLVFRQTTERPEGIETGVAKLVGANEERIVSEATKLLQDKTAYEYMRRAENPYGDGHAAARICDALAAHEVFCA